MEDQEVMHEQADVEDNQKQEQLADNEVRLSDGRLVVMRETTGADDAAVAKMLGDNVSLQGAGAAILVQATALKAVVSIDGQDAPILASYKNFLAFSSKFKSKDLRKIQVKYMQMNSEADPDSPLV